MLGDDSMLKKRHISLFLILILLLCGCSSTKDDDLAQDNAKDDPIIIDLPTTKPDEDPNPTPEQTTPEPDTKPDVNPEPTPEPDETQHSELFIPDHSTYQILTYFEEVVLNVEYNDGTGDVSLVQKWLSPIYYQFYGSYTDTDKIILEQLFEKLNSIPGFPGIYQATSETPENLSLSFLEPADFTAAFSNVVQGEDANGATEFWYYTATNEIYTARIGYRTDLDQNIRNSILIEEIINTLGISDTELRTDSVVYQFSDENTSLSEIDILILKLLYNDEIQCGMNFDSCAEIINKLYY